MANISAAKVLAEDELDSSTLEAAIDEILGMQCFTNPETMNIFFTYVILQPPSLIKLC